MIRQFELVDRVSAYVPDLDESILNRAYVFAVTKHGTQKRDSGDPYFSHPVEVAGILTELKLDPETIVTGLLHDTLEDTDATPEEITELFGEDVMRLVDGVTKLSQIEIKSSSSKQAENFRKFLLATANDIRILIVKLADRLHNMRTLHYIKSAEKRQRIALETMEIYAPLAGRMGIQSFREELEDLSFKELNPEGCELVEKRLKELHDENGEMLNSIAYDIHNVLAEQGMSVTVLGRQKKPFAIWRKMENKSISLEQLSDIFGFRVIADSEAECYRALGVIHTNWKFIQGRFKDYISVPKSNDYSSLHTTILGPNRQRVEIQIRTEAMHNIAENGVAAHWLYKEKAGAKKPNMNDIDPFKWLQELVGQLKSGDSAEEFMENTKLELFHDRVFCFTPKGRLIALPDGATPLDFAYAVHTEIGNKCIGVRINGNQEPLRKKLQSGDEVEILTGDEVNIGLSWEQIAVTGKARAAIRHAHKEKQILQKTQIGLDVIEGVFRAEKVDVNDAVLERALAPFECADLPELYVKVGSGEITGSDVLRKVYPRRKSGNFIFKAMQSFTTRRKNPKETIPHLPITGLTSTEGLSIAPDCFPLPGDRIVGISIPNEGIHIYPADAASLADFENLPERWVALQWDMTAKKKQYFSSRLNLTVFNQVGTLGEIADTMGAFGVNISNLQLTQKDEDFCDLQIDVQVRDVKHISELITALRGSRLVNNVKRVVG